MVRFLSVFLASLILLAATAFSSQRVSNTCLFAGGPRSSQTQAYPGLPSIPLGSPCNDGRGSYGFAVHDGRQPVGRFAILKWKANVLRHH